MVTLWSCIQSFNLSLPFTEAVVHGLSAAPTANIYCGNDLQWPQPLHKALQLQVATVLTVWNTCNRQSINDKSPQSFKDFMKTH